MKDNFTCGNCANFKPKGGDKFFNCTLARQGGIRYGMQVRADTISCEAFSQIEQPPKLQAMSKPGPQPPGKGARSQPPRLCNWGRVLVVTAIIIVIILVIAALAYTCSNRGSPTPTPTPTVGPPITPRPSPTSIRPTPTPEPTPIPVIYYNLGDWAVAPPWLITVSDAEKTTRYYGPGPIDAPPNTFFIIVQVTVNNGGNSTLGIKASNFTLQDQNGLAYPAIQWGQIVPNQFPWELRQLFPGQTVSGRILYTVPSFASKLDIVHFVFGQYYLKWTLPY